MASKRRVITVELPGDVAKYARESAAREDVSVETWIAYRLEQHVNRERRAQAAVQRTREAEE